MNRKLAGALGANTNALNMDNTFLNQLDLHTLERSSRTPVPVRKRPRYNTIQDDSPKSSHVAVSAENSDARSLLDDTFECSVSTQMLVKNSIVSSNGESSSSYISENTEQVEANVESPFLQKAKCMQKNGLKLRTQFFLDDEDDDVLNSVVSQAGRCTASDASGTVERGPIIVNNKTGKENDPVWGNESGIVQGFNDNQYRRETDALFDSLEDSICDMGGSKCAPIVYALTPKASTQQQILVCRADTIVKNQSPGEFTAGECHPTIDHEVELLEKSLRTPSIIRRVLETAAESLKSMTSPGQVAQPVPVNSNNTMWYDETMLANAVVNFTMRQQTHVKQTQDGTGFGALIRRAMAHKSTADTDRIVITSPFCTAQNTPDMQHLGSFYGLPTQVADLIKMYKGINKLYEWQDECLNLPAIMDRRNLIYALPTSGGKTLVAEILILRELLCYKKNVLFILPFVSIVQEKVWSLSPFAVALDFLVEEYAAGKGMYPPRKRRRKRTVYVATMEKALGLFDSLLEANRSSELGLIVVDELHLLGDDSRGGVLESLLTKVKLIEHKIHVVGMSATIGNINEICTFMDAEVYSKDFRPVELIEYVKIGDDLMKINWAAKNSGELYTFSRKFNFSYTESKKTLDPDCIGGLVGEVIPNESCLIFCPSKKNCENVALLLSKVLPQSLKNHRAAEKNLLLAAIKSETGNLCPIIANTLKFGIVYHHSGLTFEERRMFEEAYRQGVLCVICCTSTLAAGVNLPAKRVILRKPYVGLDFINLSRYKQMVGRAGRAGLAGSDAFGESIVLCTLGSDLNRLSALFMSPMDVALSALGRETRGLRHLLLSCINLKLAECRVDLQEIAKKTLLYVQKDRQQVDIKRLTDKSISDLFKLGALQIQDHLIAADSNVSVNIDTTQGQCIATPSRSGTVAGVLQRPKTKLIVNSTSKLVISKMGIAAIKSGLELSRAHVLFEDLLLAQASLVLLDNLHLLYLVTPYEISEQVKPQRALYFALYSELGLKELQTAKIIGITEPVANKLLGAQPITNLPERVLNRFYVTLMLNDLWNEIPVYEVAEKFQINRGLIQNLMTSAATFANSVVHFCNEFEEFWSYCYLLKGMGSRLAHCCMKELLPLMDLPSVKQSRAKQLYNNGYKTLQSIAKANPDDLVMNIEFMPRKTANQLIAAAKLILLEKVENLREEAQDVLDGNMDI